MPYGPTIKQATYLIYILSAYSLYAVLDIPKVRWISPETIYKIIDLIKFDVYQSIWFKKFCTKAQLQILVILLYFSLTYLELFCLVSILPYGKKQFITCYRHNSFISPISYHRVAFPTAGLSIRE